MGRQRHSAEEAINKLRQAIAELGKGNTVAGVRTLFIERGSPHLHVGSNDYVESFNGKLRDEPLNGEIFSTLREAKIMTERWRNEYNRIRPHSSLGYRPPAPEAIAAGGPAAEERGSGIIVSGAT